MSAKKDGRIIVVVKKKKNHHPHHGGSWKVAYADFVTAMMAFFLVMWVMGMDPEVKDVIQGYFANPIGFERGYSSGANMLATGSPPTNAEIQRLVMIAREHQRRRFEEARQEIHDRLTASPELANLEAQVEIVLTSEGLRIELVETGDGQTFFPFGASTLTPAAARALGIIAAEVAQLPNEVMIEGHTDAARYTRENYSNWELSVDRANAARRAMEAAGFQRARVLEVRGYADRRLRVPENPFDPANRRVTILLPFKDPQPPLDRLVAQPPDGESAD